jgi:Tol biopolymer transport system component
MIDEQDVRDMMRRRAEAIPAAPVDTPSALRRARRRRARTLAVGALTAAGLIVGAVVGVAQITAMPHLTPATQTPPGTLPRNGDITALNSVGTVAIDPQTGKGRGILVAHPSSVMTWSPDGTRLASASFSDPAGIWVTDLAAHEFHRILPCNPTGLTPDCPSGIAWSPDGSRIALVRGRSPLTPGQPGPVRLELIDPDGGHLTTVVQLDQSGSTSGPSWSPDGTRLVFAASPRIYQVYPDGSGLRVLFDGQRAFLSDPAWSPDGTRIAYSAVAQGVPFGSGGHVTQIQQIWIMQTDGSHPMKIFQSRPLRLTVPYFGSAPVWSPDGTMIAVGLADGLHVMDADGSGDHVISRWAGAVVGWRPGG